MYRIPKNMLILYYNINNNINNKITFDSDIVGETMTTKSFYLISVFGMEHKQTHSHPKHI